MNGKAKLLNGLQQLAQEATSLHKRVSSISDIPAACVSVGEELLDNAYAKLVRLSRELDSAEILQDVGPCQEESFTDESILEPSILNKSSNATRHDETDGDVVVKEEEEELWPDEEDDDFIIQEMDAVLDNSNIEEEVEEEEAEVLSNVPSSVKQTPFNHRNRQKDGRPAKQKQLLSPVEFLELHLDKKNETWKQKLLKMNTEMCKVHKQGAATTYQWYRKRITMTDEKRKASNEGAKLRMRKMRARKKAEKEAKKARLAAAGVIEETSSATLTLLSEDITRCALQAEQGRHTDAENVKRLKEEAEEVLAYCQNEDTNEEVEEIKNATTCIVKEKKQLIGKHQNEQSWHANRALSQVQTQSFQLRTKLVSCLSSKEDRLAEPEQRTMAPANSAQLPKTKKKSEWRQKLKEKDPSGCKETFRQKDASYQRYRRRKMTDEERKINNERSKLRMRKMRARRKAEKARLAAEGIGKEETQAKQRELSEDEMRRAKETARKRCYRANLSEEKRNEVNAKRREQRKIKQEEMLRSESM